MHFSSCQCDCECSAGWKACIPQESCSHTATSPKTLPLPSFSLLLPPPPPPSSFLPLAPPSSHPRGRMNVWGYGRYDRFDRFNRSDRYDRSWMHGWGFFHAGLLASHPLIDRTRIRDQIVSREFDLVVVGRCVCLEGARQHSSAHSFRDFLAHSLALSLLRPPASSIPSARLPPRTCIPTSCICILPQHLPRYHRAPRTRGGARRRPGRASILARWVCIDCGRRWMWWSANARHTVHK